MVEAAERCLNLGVGGELAARLACARPSEHGAEDAAASTSCGLALAADEGEALDARDLRPACLRGRPAHGLQRPISRSLVIVRAWERGLATSRVDPRLTIYWLFGFCFFCFASGSAASGST